MVKAGFVGVSKASDVVEVLGSAGDVGVVGVSVETTICDNVSCLILNNS